MIAGGLAGAYAGYTNPYFTEAVNGAQAGIFDTNYPCAWSAVGISFGGMGLVAGAGAAGLKNNACL